MTLAVIRHSVQDYAAWRKVYDSVASMQKAGGVLEESVYQMKGDPNDVLVLHSFADHATAEAFFAKQELREAMHQGGVAGPPRIELWEEAK